MTLGGLTSCEDYLDKEPGTDVDSAEAFKDFRNFQGYVEEMYNCIPTKTCHYWNATFNWGDDEVMTTGDGDIHMTSCFDRGDFKSYYTNWGGCFSYLYGNSNSHTSTDRMAHHIWNEAWYCIRKCNLGLANLDLMKDATSEERKVIEGELYFFRAWWYEEMIIWWGGMPYMTEVADGGSFKLPRESFQECARKSAEDFMKAAELLPANWDKSSVGKSTSGQNQLRVTSATALAYAGKMYLYAASPLAELGPQLGASANGNTYKYNTDFAKKAADALGTAITMIENNETPYSLANYYLRDNYKSDEEYFDALYNHDRSSTGASCFSDICYTVKQGFKLPGSTEAMMRGTGHGQSNDARWGFATMLGCNVGGLFNGNMTVSPGANYVANYGMANGLPLDDPNSGFDPTHPFKNRDPRFYHDIVFDGERYINDEKAKDYEQYQYCDLANDGIMINTQKGSRTGYLSQKLAPHTCNAADKVMDDWAAGYKVYVPYLRVADVYLMYAEAGAAAEGAKHTAKTCAKSAEDAINVLRDRVGAGHVAAAYAGDQKKFIDEVRRERAVELSFEGFRFNDLQRWLLLTEPKYVTKTRQTFDAVYPNQKYELKNDKGEVTKSYMGKNEWYHKNDPREAEVKNWGETTVLVRPLGEKHYWLPIIDKQTYLYEDFPQNPGW